MSDRAAMLQRLLGSLVTQRAQPLAQPTAPGRQSVDPIRQELQRQRARQRRIAAVFFRREP